jgi:uncharacterized protein YjeT (DUF2065 family)
MLICLKIASLSTPEAQRKTVENLSDLVTNGLRQLGEKLR